MTNDVVVWGQSKMPEQKGKRTLYGIVQEPDISNQQTLRDLNDLGKLMRTSIKSGFSCKKMLKLLSYLLKFDEEAMRKMLYSPRYEDMFLSYNQTLGRVEELSRMYSKKLLSDAMTKCKSEIGRVIDDLNHWHNAILTQSIRKKQGNTDNLHRFMETARIDNIMFHNNKIVHPSFFKRHYQPFIEPPSKLPKSHPFQSPVVSTQKQKVRILPPKPTYAPPPPPFAFQQQQQKQQRQKL